jgi:uncharacterized membrane protein YraQ (UPF0718 family)
LPAAVSLQKQGANKGATTAFLISTPESGVDSIAVTYALLDPVITVARPAAALITATAAGVAQNVLDRGEGVTPTTPDLSCPVDGCCDRTFCSTEEHKRHHTFGEKIWAGIKYAVTDVWSDMASWFLIGLLLAGLITSVVPEAWFSSYLGGGLASMLIMLAVGIPLYICATASTPIAAALILKGVSPGAALVFLLAGPATNVTSLTVLLKVLGKRATGIYLFAIALFTVLFGLLLDKVYGLFGLVPQALVGKAGELMPAWAEWFGAAVLLILSVKPVWHGLKARWNREGGHHHDHVEGSTKPPDSAAEIPACTGPT